MKRANLVFFGVCDGTDGGGAGSSHGQEPIGQDSSWCPRWLVQVGCSSGLSSFANIDLEQSFGISLQVAWKLAVTQLIYYAMSPHIR